MTQSGKETQMAISWDENQLPALSAWIVEKLPMTDGGLAIASMELPENCFAGSVNLTDKEFIVFANVDSPMVDITMNVFLGYIIALAYDKSGWAGLPSHEVLFDCHRLVCEAMLDFNEEFAKGLEEHADILDTWHETHAADESATTEVDTEDLVNEMGTSLFTVNPPDSKNYGVN